MSGLWYLAASLRRRRIERTRSRGAATMNTPGIAYYLPRETADVCNDERMKQCKNLSLLLHKYPPQTALQSSAQKNQWLRTILSNNVIDANLTMHAYRR